LTLPKSHGMESLRCLDVILFFVGFGNCGGPKRGLGMKGGKSRRRTYGDTDRGGVGYGRTKQQLIWVSYDRV